MEAETPRETAADQPIAESANPNIENAAEAVAPPAESTTVSESVDASADADAAEEATGAVKESVALEDVPAEAAGAESAPEEPQQPVAEFDAATLLGDSAKHEVSESEASDAELKAIIEAVVYVLTEPLPASAIAAALNQPTARVEAILQQLIEDTAQPARGVFIREVAGGYHLATKPEHHEAIRNFVKNLKQPLKLSTAALETLAVIAYKQPVTAPEIMEIRGVQGVGVLKTLLDRKLITSAGRKNVVGKPMLYKTTKEFLTQFGLNSINELPTLKEFEELRRQSIVDDELPDVDKPAAVTGEVVHDDEDGKSESASADAPAEQQESVPAAADSEETKAAPEAETEVSEAAASGENNG